VFFREEFPDHPIFRHPLFATHDYAVFADKIRRACAQTEDGDPHGVLVEKALPALGEKLRAVVGTIQSGNEATVIELRDLKGKVDRLGEAVEESLSNTVSFTFTPGRSRMVREVGTSRQREVSPSPAGRGSFHLGEPALRQPQPPPICLSGSGPAPLPLGPLEQLRPASVPSYKLSRQVRTVTNLWKEWTVGLAGQPSVTRLDNDYGSAWRTGAERQYYSSRKVIVDEVRRRAGPGAGDMACKKMAETMEKDREQANISLDKMFKILKAEAKARAGRG
jgi:Transcriptional activator of glycolytic enzymes